MAKFHRLKDSNIPNSPLDLTDFAKEVIFDGYDFGDRVLEGCYLKATWSPKARKYKVDGWYDGKGGILDGSKDPYYCTLNEKYWFKIAEKYINDTDIAETVRYEEVYSEDY